MLFLLPFTPRTSGTQSGKNIHAPRNSLATLMDSWSETRLENLVHSLTRSQSIFVFACSRHSRCHFLYVYLEPGNSPSELGSPLREWLGEIGYWQQKFSKRLLYKLSGPYRSMVHRLFKIPLTKNQGLKRKDHIVPLKMDFGQLQLKA